MLAASASASATPSASAFLRARRTGTALALGAAALALTGCSGIADDLADIWAITYQVSTDGTATGGLVDVSYAEASHRGRPSIVKDVGSAGLAPTDDGSGAVWSVDSVVTAEDWAFVTATPVDGEALTCRILIDGTREIASSTAAPGQPVTCQLPTPAFG